MLNLSPEVFRDVILVGLLHEHWPPIKKKNRRGGWVLHYGWSTVDHVLKVLRQMGEVTDGQIRLVQERRSGFLHQRRLSACCGSTKTPDTDQKSFILIREAQFSCTTNLMKLVRNAPIQMTETGARYAKTILPNFPQITKDSYLRAVDELASKFKTPASHAAATKRYRARVNSELNEK